MILTKGKKEFAIKKALELIKTCDNYEINQMSMVRNFKFCPERFQYIDLHYSKSDKNWVISKLDIKRNDVNLSIDYTDDVKSLLDSFEKEMSEIIKKIDDKKFKRMFPEWDPVEDRDVKLAELLDMDPVQEIKVEKTKKKFSIF